MTATGHFTVLQAALPGAAPENIGVLLVDDSGSAHLKIRRDLRSLADEDDAEYLEALQFDLRQKASELGGESLMRWLVENLSNFLRVSDPEETPVGLAGSRSAALYIRAYPSARPAIPDPSAHVHARGGGGKLGRGDGSLEEDWVEAPADLRLTDDMFVAHVVGRSMEPRIPAGSLCVFRRNVTGSRQGRLVLVENYGETGENRYTIKRYKSVKRQTGDEWEHETIRLEPLNPEYEAWELSPSDIRVVGEFVRVLD